MQIPFSHRPPSTQWEPLPIVRIPGLTLWAWYRPQHLPLGLIVSVPSEMLAVSAVGFPFTLMDVLFAAGVEPVTVQAASFFGSPWQTQDILSQYLHHPVPPAAAGAKPEIAIQVSQQVMPPEAVAAPIPLSAAETSPGTLSPDQAGTDDTDPAAHKLMYDRIEKSWLSSVQMERQMTGLRQKLASVLAALGKFDRDLNPEERLAADREDRDAWQDARRWMRDLSAKCHREIKSFDVGMTSAAGKRNAIQQLYEQVIEPRAPSHELTLIRREFETYRKDMVNLQKSMQSALQSANQNGTQRAQRVLAVIGRKIRERRARMREPIGGVNLDKSVRSKS